MSLRQFLAVSALFLSAVANAELLELQTNDVTVEKDPSTSQEVVSVVLTPESRQALANFTRERVGKVIELSVDGQRILAPTVRGAIDTGSLWLSPGVDGFAGKTAQELALAIREGGRVTISDEKPAAPAVGMPNPASAFCIAQGGKLDIVSEEAGQVGYCTLPSGERVEEWALFRRERGQ